MEVIDKRINKDSLDSFKPGDVLEFWDHTVEKATGQSGLCEVFIDVTDKLMCVGIVENALQCSCLYRRL